MDIIVSEDRLRGEGPDRVKFVNTEFQRAYAAQERRRARMFEDLDMYWGDQIPSLARFNASQQGRELVVYNIAQRKVVGLVGSLLQNNFNITYLSRKGDQNTLIFTVQDMLEADKNHSNWDYNFMKFLTYGCIGGDAVMEMIERQNVDNPLGSLAFEVCTPGSVILDPNWTSDQSRDIQCTFKFHYLTPKQIMNTYGDKAEKIKDALKRELRNGSAYQERFYDDNRDNASSKGSTKQVIEYEYLEDDTHDIELDLSTGVTLPVTDDAAYKQQWMAVNNIDPNNVRVITYPKKTLKLVTICPELMQDEPLAEGLHKFQIERVTKFPWAPERICGEPRGIIALLRDMQITMNKRQNNINSIIESGANGSAFVSDGLVDGDEKAKAVIQANWTNPQFKMFVPEGKIESGKNFILPVPRNPVPNELFTQISRLYDDMDRILPVNAASDGLAQSSSESGVLFSLKSQAIIIAQTTLVRGIQNVLAEIGAAYAIAAKYKYAGVERTFTKPDGTVVKINEIVPLPNGDIGIKNDISSLQAVDTLVKMGSDSPNSRFERRAMAMGVLEKLNPQLYPDIYVNVLGEMLNTIDWDDSTGQGIKDAVDRSVKLAKAQADAQLNPPAPPAPGPASGASAPAPTNPLMPDLSALTAGAAPAPEAPPASQGSPLSQAAMSALAPLMGK
jgi:hypothetical protein